MYVSSIQYHVSFICTLHFYVLYNKAKWSWSEVAQSCPTLCDPMDCSLSGSSVHGIFQARVLEWIAISFSRGSFQPRGWTQISCIAGRRFTIWATREWHNAASLPPKKSSFHLSPYNWSPLPFCSSPNPFPSGKHYSVLWIFAFMFVWSILFTYFCLCVCMPPKIQFPFVTI